MSTQSPSATVPTEETGSCIARFKRTIGQVGLTVGVLSLVAAEPALAQTIGEDFCTTSMAETIKNVFTIIQFGGPLIGGTLALGAAVVTPVVRRTDTKLELKEVRNQGVIWGIIVAPLATTIVQFLLNTVVAGGSSCAF
ncbi:hypothetical protein [Haloarcula nitratireducens]|uniref:DUF4190 domain-containing protein n=1 Tax=Haloarcula nitratireducens TaxID=2487749 RepID=A0AAW4PKC4_9EURY|nr:hypothetical protein [Halomicroarcula nitratireducens]MBX0297896.1 hypothetical protein [Halomicroarcula nitratireducens]